MPNDYETAIGTGRNFAELGNTMAQAIRASAERGMELDEILCCIVTVAADYARANYGPGYLPGLAHVILDRATHPMPEIVP